MTHYLQSGNVVLSAPIDEALSTSVEKVEYYLSTRKCQLKKIDREWRQAGNVTGRAGAVFLLLSP